jgi:hypothetical protein
MKNPFNIGQHHIFQVKNLVISGLKLMKTITLKQILFKAKKILNKIQYPKERKKKKTKTPQTQPKKRESRERERELRKRSETRHKNGAHELKYK